MENPELKMHLCHWNFLSGEISGLYFRAGFKYDHLFQRLLDAVNEQDLDEMNHVTAVMLVVMQGRDQICAESQRQWGLLDRTYHEKFCQHPLCVERRKDSHV